MDARLRRLPRPVRRLLGVPLAPVAGYLWLGHRVMLRVFASHGITQEERELLRAWAAHSLRHGHLVSARIVAQYILAAEPRFPEGYYLLYRAYLRDGKRQKAGVVLERGLQIAPADTQLLLAQAAFNELGQRNKLAST